MSYCISSGKCSFLGKFKVQKDCNQSCQSNRVLWLVEMTCRLVHASYSLPEWQAVKLTFFAAWQCTQTLMEAHFINNKKATCLLIHWMCNYVAFFNHFPAWFLSFMPHCEGRISGAIKFMECCISVIRTLLKVKNQRRKKQKHNWRQRQKRSSHQPKIL